MHNTHPATRAATSGEVVVGIDDSLPSRVALSWAAEFARSAGDRLRAVHVFSDTDGFPVMWTNGFPPMQYVGQNSARAISEDRLHKMFEVLSPEAGWTLEFLEGSVGSELARFSAAARLLVVGTREHVGLERLVIGSVSHYCLSHAECPVAAVPPSTGPETTRQSSPVAAGQPAGAR